MSVYFGFIAGATVRARVLKAYETQYPDPIVLRAGESVTLGTRDHEFPGWIWAISTATGKAGWVPEHFLSPGSGDHATATRDYSAQELTVSEGMMVNVIEELLGWALVEAESGVSGWVPQTHLARSGSPQDMPL